MMYTIQKGNIHALPVTHYTMELAMAVKLAFDEIQPDCVAVELAETMQDELLHAASRLPDLSIIERGGRYYMCEPCDAAFEGLRSALERGIAAHCIDLEIDGYPEIKESLPDAYSILHIGLEKYYDAYQPKKHHLDHDRELYMAKRLKELSFTYDRILFIGGFAHVETVLKQIDLNRFPKLEHTSTKASETTIATLTEESCRNVMAEYGWISTAYEDWRIDPSGTLLDRQKLIYHLYKSAAEIYQESTGHSFPGYNLRNTMKFVRNYALLHGQLLPNLFEILSAAKGCVDHNYAYETWLLATSYPYRKNIDHLPELNLSIEDVWGNSKQIKFHLKQMRRKGLDFRVRHKDQNSTRFLPPSPFSICSYPPEDLVVENFGEFLKKKGNILLSEESARSLPFSTSLEDGIDTRETIRHFFERQLYVKIRGRPPGAASSVVIIFDEDKNHSFPWQTTWLGEHNQESDMAFYATPTNRNIVGPGISRCQYGGFMMSSPPRRLYDIWNDPDYYGCHSKAEVLLMAAIDYSVKPIIVYVAEKPPRAKMKSFASRFGKKIVFLPIGQLSPQMLNKIRTFHVLDGHDKREIAGDYIF